MDCEFRIGNWCEIYEINCDVPEENNPDNYQEDSVICGCYSPINKSIVDKEV